MIESAGWNSGLGGVLGGLPESVITAGVDSTVVSAAGSRVAAFVFAASASARIRIASASDIQA